MNNECPVGPNSTPRPGSRTRGGRPASCVGGVHLSFALGLAAVVCWCVGLGEASPRGIVVGTLVSWAEAWCCWARGRVPGSCPPALVSALGSRSQKRLQPASQSPGEAPLLPASLGGSLRPTDGLAKPL